MTNDKFHIKVSKSGYNVDGKVGKPALSKRPDAHILLSLAIPYLMGAHITLERYKQAASSLRDTPVKAVQMCLYEASTLFENLSTITKYVRMCGENNRYHNTWTDIRNHIRHDYREEFDKEDRKWKNTRSEKLGLDKALQTDISFSEESIKVGKVTITTKDVQDYIFWASKLFNKTMDEARAKGYISELEWHPDIMNS
jgi:hypothetical protein